MKMMSRHQKLSYFHALAFCLSSTLVALRKDAFCVLAQSESSWEVLSYEDFEKEGVLWTEEEGSNASDGLKWCSSNRPYATEGKCAMCLEDDRTGNSQTASSAVLSQGIDLSDTSYDNYRISFSFLATSFDGFWENFQLHVSFDNSASWTPIRNFKWKDDFETFDPSSNAESNFHKDASVIVPAIKSVVLLEDDFRDTTVSDTYFNGAPYSWNCARAYACGPDASAGDKISVRFNKAKVMTLKQGVLKGSNVPVEYSEVRINFKYLLANINKPEHKYVLDVSEDGGQTWTTQVKTWPDEWYDSNENWNDGVATLSPSKASVFSLDTFMVRFDLVGATAWSEVVHMDNLRITGVPSIGASPFMNFRFSLPSARYANGDRLYVDNIEIAGQKSTEEPPKEEDPVPTDRDSICPKARVKGSAPNKPYYTLPALDSLTREVSYMAFSAQTYGPDKHKVMWAGSDGPQTSITAFDIETSTKICEYKLGLDASTIAASNWESMSLGPCDSSGTSICLYLGNMGNNGAEGCTSTPCTTGLDFVEIYKLPEPDVNAACPSDLQDVVVLQVDYKHPDMPTDRADSDAMFVDYTGDGSNNSSPGDIYILTRNRIDGALSRVALFPSSEHGSLKAQDPVKRFSVVPVMSDLVGRRWTDADVSKDGHLIALRDTEYVYFYPRLDGQSVVQALTGSPCDFASATVLGGKHMDQYEAIALVDSKTMIEASECDALSTGGNADCVTTLTLYELLPLVGGSEGSVGNWTPLLEDNFEGNAWGGWVSSGQYATLQQKAGYAKDTTSVELSFEGVESMVNTKSVLDATPYQQLQFKFDFILEGFDDTSDAVFLEVSNNGGLDYFFEVYEWTYKRGLDGNNEWHSAAFIIDPTSISFTEMIKFRIRIDANSANDSVYVDNIQISGRAITLPSSSSSAPTYEPGHLQPADHLGVQWSRGLTARMIARTNEAVPLKGGGKSRALYHTDPDAGACFDTPNGGWVYVCNSEDKWAASKPNEGGVGAIYFDSNGHVIDYQWILSKTNDNCGGGKSPWDTWITCEEDGSIGAVFEVDPQGPHGSTPLDPDHKYGRRTCLGEGGGNYESAAFDGRQLDLDKCKGGDLSWCKVDFFITNDADLGDVRMYTPKASVVQSGLQSNNVMSILQDDSVQTPYSACADKREGEMKYIKITEGSGGDSGKFEWTTSRAEGGASASANYPYNEGVDVKDGMLYVISKTTKFLFTFDLDKLTWFRSSTKHGVFDGQPDQIARATGSTDGLLYFTEDGGSHCGIHAQSPQGQYLTICQSDGSHYVTETTGLAFSPDRKHMYFAFQGYGDIWDVTREDGLEFNGDFLDVKYHNAAFSAPQGSRASPVGIAAATGVRKLRG